MKDLEDFDDERLSDILVKFKEFEFAEDCKTPHTEFKEKLEFHLDEFRQGVNDVLAIQKKMSTIISETEDLMELRRRLRDHEKISEIVDEYIEGLNLEAITEEYQTVLKKVSEYRDLFRGLRNIERYMCSVCLEATIDTVLDPCGHTVCTLCSDRIGKKCPYCRGTVFKTKRLIFS